MRIVSESKPINPKARDDKRTKKITKRSRSGAADFISKLYELVEVN